MTKSSDGVSSRAAAGRGGQVRVGCDDGGPGSAPHAHAHDHGHDHDGADHDCGHAHGLAAPATGQAVRPLAVALGIALGIFVLQAVGGYLTNSLALLADAGHLATDSAALVLALVAGWLARRPVTGRRTFGWRRAGVLAAFTNAAALFVVAGLITWEAVGRIGAPPDIASGPMLAIAVVGLVANGVMLRVLSGGGGHGHAHDMNTRAARLHVLGDLLGSVGAIAAGVIMLTTGWYLADPILSIVVSALILRGAWAILRDATDVLMDAAPAELGADRVGAELVAVPGVAGLHDLHVWTVAPGQVSLTGHVELTGDRPWGAVLADLTRLLQSRFGIEHLTLQPEGADLAGAPLAPRRHAATTAGCCLDAYRAARPAQPALDHAH